MCGVDGVAYANACEASCATTGLANSTESCDLEGLFSNSTLELTDEHDCGCNVHYEPVCGSDGETYLHYCLAECAGATVVSEGYCPDESPVPTLSPPPTASMPPSARPSTVAPVHFPTARPAPTSPPSISSSALSALTTDLTHALCFEQCELADQLGAGMDVSLESGASCEVGVGLSLDGTYDYAELDSVHIGGPMSLAVWARWDATDEYYSRLFTAAEDEVGSGCCPVLNETIVIRNYDHTQVQVIVQHGQGDHLSESQQRLNSDTGVITAGEWAHIALTADGSHLRLFVDGELVSQITGDAPTLRRRRYHLLGKPAGTTSEHCFQGAIRSLYTWSRPLGSDEIVTLSSMSDCLTARQPPPTASPSVPSTDGQSTSAPTVAPSISLAIAPVSSAPTAAPSVPITVTPVTGAPTALSMCYEDCRGGCMSWLTGDCLDDCADGTAMLSHVVERCCYQASYSYGFNPFAFSPCPAQVIVTTSIELAGLDCNNFSDQEEAIVIAAVAASIDSVQPEHIGDTTCFAASRRTLFSSSATVSFDITVCKNGKILGCVR